MNGQGSIRPENGPHELEGEISEIRGRLDHSLAELDRRRHEATDIKLQIRRHPGAVAAAGGVVLLLLGGVAYAIWAAHRREQPMNKVKRLRLAVSRMIDEPQKVAKAEPTVPEKILAAASTVAATMITRKLIERAMNTAGQKQRAI
ncbi:MAG: hypothetical protein E6J62_05670 [Deltaproteobacteria bacterium]|nr:MAG: hypothetical protein E6J85_19350 [Deltaproteobacteria bacterium]TMB37163.1 MAG: hypothetical protein E6J62_05670 [Deltaproteobacteria bacterium]